MSPYKCHSIDGKEIDKDYKQLKNMRYFFSWVVGIIIFILMLAVEDFLRGVMGLTTYIDYGETIIIEHRYYEEEVDGHYTGIGYFFKYIALWVAIRGGMAIYDGRLNDGLIGRLNAGVSNKDNFIQFMVGVFLLIYGITNQLIYFVFELTPSFFVGLLDSTIGIGIGYLCYQYYICKSVTIKDEDEYS